ncbi:MAG: 16S rRNA (cytosine(1402)-N(4))-methyltransferase RsmH [Planctomycetes bacterium]|nr:16S rRNA (cytosine(1402)-N(4))-methyltransferase RsmH [Planctomycetota bacterium]
MELAPGMVVVDGTVGAGGHARAFAARLGAEGVLVGLDQDAEILVHAEAALGGASSSAVEGGSTAAEGSAAPAPRSSPAPRIVLRHASFAAIEAELASVGLSVCDRVFLDLGVSSLQLDTSSRGFSFMRDGPLDMRMNRSADVPSAAEWLRSVRPDVLERSLADLGGERHARRVAAAIVDARRRAPLTRTGQLADVVVRALPPKARHGRIHAATRSFQAIRMAVNDELGALQRGLEGALRVLRKGTGRLCVITFHSAEDRIVKRFLRERTTLPFRKPIEAGDDECRRNPRARSARLRCGIAPDCQSAGSAPPPATHGEIAS